MASEIFLTVFIGSVLSVAKDNRKVVLSPLHHVSNSQLMTSVTDPPIRQKNSLVLYYCVKCDCRCPSPNRLSQSPTPKIPSILKPQPGFLQPLPPTRATGHHRLLHARMIAARQHRGTYSSALACRPSPAPLSPTPSQQPPPLPHPSSCACVAAARGESAASAACHTASLPAPAAAC